MLCVLPPTNQQTWLATNQVVAESTEYKICTSVFPTASYANLFRNVTRLLGVTPELFYPIGSQYPQYTTYRNLIYCKTGLNRE